MRLILVLVSLMSVFIAALVMIPAPVAANRRVRNKFAGLNL